jgi:SH3-like domain-containing protein
MRRALEIAIVAILLQILTGVACAATLNVAVKESPQRATATPFGRVLANLRYGTQVEVLERQGAWVRVKAAGAGSGWVHASALSEKRLALQSGKGAVKSGASAEELTLAGKGFNAQVEGEYRQRNRDLNYQWVERMESTVIPTEDLQRFVREGRLAAGGTP